LLVFAYLIVPAVAAAVLSPTPSRRLLIGWGVGAAGSGAGIAGSFRWGLPTGGPRVAALGALVAALGGGGGLRGVCPMGRGARRADGDDGGGCRDRACRRVARRRAAGGSRLAGRGRAHHPADADGVSVASRARRRRRRAAGDRARRPRGRGAPGASGRRRVGR